MTETETSPVHSDEIDSLFPQYTLFNVKIDPGLQDDDGIEIPRPFTKNQMRKWLKKVKWENRKARKRAAEKERRRKAREANIDFGPSRKALKKMNQERSKQNIGVIIDLSFDDLMIQKDRFKVEFHEKSYLELFPKEKLIYLTSESDNVIEHFDENTFYVIGGLVDHNKHKGLCHKIANEQGIRHAQLPLNKYVNMKTRKVLTIDQVFEIILRVCEGMCWQETLINVLPERKGAHACDDEDNSGSDTAQNDKLEKQT
ncbi:tRNA methyltransferase 10 homolog A isoform X2 [Amyelois transitella]|uniref:tRNA methyltransferase 10 homolog A isoform X2 n=1 Tax=Amyelois transitella TaxID=680683 RepID=UPI00298F5D2E|nr:tRNA methyltransferase 10 homolog A isoform X2 [Amyelois transitella]